MLLPDASNFRNYRQGRAYRYVGGQPLRSPLRLEIPHTGHWHVAIDLAGAAGQIHSNVRVLDRVS